MQRERGMGEKYKERLVYYKMKMGYTVFFKLYAKEDFRRPCRESYYDVTSRCRNKEECQTEKDHIQSRTSQQRDGLEEIQKKCVEDVK